MLCDPMNEVITIHIVPDFVKMLGDTMADANIDAIVPGYVEMLGDAIIIAITFLNFLS